MTLRPWSDKVICLTAVSALAWAAACSPSAGTTHPDRLGDESGGASGASGGASGTGGGTSDTGGGTSSSGGSNPGSGGDPNSGGTGQGSGGDPSAGGTGQGSGGDPSSGGTGQGSGGDPSSGGSGSGGGGPLPAFDAGPDSLNDVTAGGVCQRLAELQCAAQEHCCAQAHSSRDACITAQKKGCVDGGLDYVTQQGRDGFDGANTPSILKAFEDKAASCDPGIGKWSTRTDALRGIVKGTLNANDFCTPPATTDAKVIASYLASCVDGDHTACLPHQVTLGNLNPDWVCTALAGINGNCFTDVNCDQSVDTHGVYCTNDLSAPTVSDNWKCVARKQVGASCDSSNQCETLLCTKGATKKNPGVCLDATADNAYCLN